MTINKQWFQRAGKILATYFCLALAAVILAPFAARLLTHVVPRIKAQLTPLKSYQVWYRIDNSLGGVATFYEARRSNGDSVHLTLTDSSNAPVSNIKRLALPSQGLTVLLATASGNNNMTTYGIGKPQLVPDFTSDCAVSGPVVPTETKLIANFTAIHTVPITNSPDGSWVLPQANCFLAETKTVNDDGTWWSKQTLTNIVLGDPPDDLFQIPSGRIEVKPSDFYISLGVPQSYRSSSFLQRQDAAYQRDLAARAANSSMF